MQWLSRLFSRHRRYDDLAVSIQEHLEERTEELMEDGMSREEAAQKARREFGNVTVDRGAQPRSMAVAHARKHLGRCEASRCLRLRKSPGFAATVILTLAIGIGANTAVFSVLNSVLIKPLPYPKSDQLVGVWLNAPGAAGLDELFRRPSALTVDVFHLLRAEPDLSIAWRVDHRHRKRHRNRRTGTGPHCVDQRWRASDARCSACCAAAGSRKPTRIRTARRP